jgi:hypothetical protein
MWRIESEVSPVNNGASVEHLSYSHQHPTLNSIEFQAKSRCNISQRVIITNSYNEDSSNLNSDVGVNSKS